VHIKVGERHWHGAKADTTIGNITITAVGSHPRIDCGAADDPRFNALANTAARPRISWRRIWTASSRRV
jgi:hypothetical protein